MEDKLYKEIKHDGKPMLCFEQIHPERFDTEYRPGNSKLVAVTDEEICQARQDFATYGYCRCHLVHDVSVGSGWMYRVCGICGHSLRLVNDYENQTNISVSDSR